MQANKLNKNEKISYFMGVQGLNELPETQMYYAIDYDELSDADAKKWAKIYNAAIEKLLKSKICAIISKIRERNISIKNEKNYNQLSEQGELLCENLIGTLDKSISEISAKTHDIPVKSKVFKPKEFAIKSGLDTYMQVRRNNHISKLRRKYELKNLRTELEPLGTDFKKVDDRTEKEGRVIKLLKISLENLNIIPDEDLEKLIKSLDAIAEKERCA